MNAVERTLPALFERAVEQYRSNIFLLEKKENAYRGLTFHEVREAVHSCAAGLIALGLKRGDRVALFSEGRRDWVIAELGILYAGAVNVPLSVKIEEPAELQFRLAHSGCHMVVVSGRQVQKIVSIWDRLPDLKTMILLDAEKAACDGEIPFTAVMESGKNWLSVHREEFETTWRSIREKDPANICYTSGTTADPKGIVLTHRNYTANIEQSVALYPLPEWFVTLLILPWDHAFAHTDGIYALGCCGGAVASVQAGKNAIETLRNIPANIKEIRPTFLLSVPALAKNFRRSIENGVRSKGIVAWGLFKVGLMISNAHDADGFNTGKGMRILAKPFRYLFDAILFRKIRENFGGRLEYFIGGGALLDIELQRFFYAIGIPMFQGYGLTEAAPVISANTPSKHKFGTSGILVPGLELRICDDAGRILPEGVKGEIVVRGENVMAGYWRNEQATAETIRDGWLYTGDLGYVDKDGFLVVLGRAKSLLIGHDGEKYSPEGIEEAIVGCSPLVDQIMLFNNQSPYTVALIVPNQSALLHWMRGNYHQWEDLKGAKAALTRLQSEIDMFKSRGRYEGQFPERWLPSAIAVLEEQFTEQNHLLNSTLKMVRGRIAAAYGERIQFMFTAEGKNLLNDPNLQAIRTLLRPSNTEISG